jgi:uncharacterized membrane protein YhaH (DUF805 family)
MIRFEVFEIKLERRLNMKTNSTDSKRIRGEFRWLYWDDKSDFPQIGDGFNYSFLLVCMLNCISCIHHPKPIGFDWELLYGICFSIVFFIAWALLTVVRLRYLQRSLFWATLILPQPVLFFYQMRHWHYWDWILVNFVILITTIILYLAKPRNLSVCQTPSPEQPTV